MLPFLILEIIFAFEAAVIAVSDPDKKPDNRIRKMIYSFNPDAIVFLSSASATLFTEKCSEELLSRVKNMQLFAIGIETASTLKKLNYKNIEVPDYPNIKALSEIIYNFAEGSTKG